MAGGRLRTAGDRRATRLGRGSPGPTPQRVGGLGASRDVSLASDTYHIVIDLATMHLQLFNHGQQVADFPAGIGVPGDPTPTGHFFVALFATRPHPATAPS